MDEIRDVSRNKLRKSHHVNLRVWKQSTFEDERPNLSMLQVLKCRHLLSTRLKKDVRTQHDYYKRLLRYFFQSR